MSKGKGKARNPTFHTVNLLEELNRLGFNPVAQLILTLAEIEDPKDRADILEKIWRYIFPQRKAVDITGHTTTTQVALTPQQLAAILSADAFRAAMPVQSVAKEPEKPIEVKELTDAAKDPFSD